MQQNTSVRLSEDDAVPSGIACLCFVAHAHQIRKDIGQLTHEFGLAGSEASEQDILRVARSLDLKAAIAPSDWERLPRVSLPAIARMEDDSFIVIISVQGAQALVFNPRHGDAPYLLERHKLEAEWSGELILIQSRVEPAEPEKRFGPKWFLPILYKYRSVVLEAFLASFFVQLLGLATPFLNQVIIDKVIMHKNLSTLMVLGVGMIGVIIFEAILTGLREYLMSHTINRIDVILSARIVSHLLRLPLRYFESRRAGETIARVRELEQIRQFISNTSISSVLDVLFIIVFFVVMLSYSVTLTLVVLATLPLFILMPIVMRPIVRASENRRFQRTSERQSYLVEVISGIHTIKSLAVEPMLKRRWETLLARYAAANLERSHHGAIVIVGSQLIQQVATLSLMWVGAVLVIRGELSVGQVIAFQMLSVRVLGPLVGLVRVWQDFLQVGVSIQRLGDILNETPESQPQPEKSEAAPLQGALELSGVRFRYAPNGRHILNDLGFSIAAGQTVGIVGRSGSGKSTLAKLLQGLYFAEAGTVLIDGINIKKIDPLWLRRQIGVVLQESFLMAASIRDNISIHQPHATLEDIRRAAQLAGADEFICEMDNGYDTQVGERGISLSGGQRQRIAIARALLADPRILIFDEATSALDYETERIIQKNLAKIAEGRTVFIIAHRLSTIRHSGTILVMEQGKVVEQGSHHELISMGGVYSHLFSQQDPLHHAVETH